MSWLDTTWQSVEIWLELFLTGSKDLEKQLKSLYESELSIGHGLGKFTSIMARCQRKRKVHRSVERSPPISGDYASCLCIRTWDNPTLPCYASLSSHQAASSHITANSCLQRRSLQKWTTKYFVLITVNTSQGVPSCLKPKSLGLAGSAWLAWLGWLGLAWGQTQNPSQTRHKNQLNIQVSTLFTLFDPF